MRAFKRARLHDYEFCIVLLGRIWETFQATKAVRTPRSIRAGVTRGYSVKIYDLERCTLT